MGPAGCRSTTQQLAAPRKPAPTRQNARSTRHAPRSRPAAAPAAPPAPRQHQARKSAGGDRKVSDFFGVCFQSTWCGPFGLKFLSRTQNRPSFQSVKVSAKKMPCTARCGARKVTKFQKVQNMEKWKKVKTNSRPAPDNAFPSRRSNARAALGSGRQGCGRAVCGCMFYKVSARPGP